MAWIVQRKSKGCGSTQLWTEAGALANAKEIVQARGKLTEVGRIKSDDDNNEWRGQAFVVSRKHAMRLLSADRPRGRGCIGANHPRRRLFLPLPLPLKLPLEGSHLQILAGLSLMQGPTPRSASSPIGRQPYRPDPRSPSHGRQNLAASRTTYAGRVNDCQSSRSRR